MIKAPIGIIVVTLAAAGFAAAPALAQEGGRPLAAHLMGSPTTDPDGMGHATFRVNVGQNQVCYDITTEKIAAATMAHIHKGGPAEAGPVAIALKAPDATGKVKDCATADAAVVKDILQKPGDYDVNVHNGEFGGGAIRGQLSK